ncbi:hypothetical protein A2631_04210 [Candidatus Daviesbacteria bacterium RIFCSPHIGHO2_01_FULL_44_29]|uniref:Polymerase/histidinol phosphatase N-terminal domain-containing protein n=1 Tax=Candidatus Daviesbacteria bacterium RIFCSPHIGHO2_02_FULL_43_12 TaxID=1797776 RepID=A0A1F5KGC1_9BACT|nr:MAG: hypothetical protein A2631_04210 [Candidatus Daviesbacteria bacterium RIFCSPHIGHO2_01_FULL_44_29]OGE39928.1 MAG: hypothetical protein A3D25_03940 [Candidatus Daviesbacteria bacterium RIFCSPHIGHO2_02_FULL_43_12]OGE40514.1 MAG: hypothetical protein A3E86_00845 [Candidatus Daviesbacteria bacterium RIFCSPHIGHO2_12_FULL_47_45]OGE70391.1 MAG: hypothetical protein A3B55_01630 [Candidatus Daviesbacteria bacterium RIFCSPLOWO2_01_FULL_43_15]
MFELFGKFYPNQKLAELHAHSSLSKDTVNGLSPERLVRIAVEVAKIDALAITDHDSIVGSRRARNYARRRQLPIEIILLQRFQHQVAMWWLYILSKISNRI